MPSPKRHVHAAWRSCLLAALLLSAVSAAPARAGIDEGMQAYRNGDYARAFEEFLPLATAGNTTLQNQIAAMYYTGQGVPQDHTKAAEWFKKSATAGNTDGQYCLGKLYYHGQGLPQDLGEAAKWLNAAGVAGKGGAQYLLATLYLYGKGVSQNPVKAYFWSILAASSDDIPAEDKEGAVALREQIAAMLSKRQRTSIEAMAKNWAPYKKKIE